MTDAITSRPAARPASGLLHALKSLLASFVWAQEMRRRCNAETAAGRQLDGDAIRRIAREIAQEIPDLN